MTNRPYSRNAPYDGTTPTIKGEVPTLTFSLLQIAASGARLPPSYIEALNGVLAPDQDRTAMDQVDEIIEGMDIQGSQSEDF